MQFAIDRAAQNTDNANAANRDAQERLDVYLHTASGKEGKVVADALMRGRAAGDGHGDQTAGALSSRCDGLSYVF